MSFFEVYKHLIFPEGRVKYLLLSLIIVLLAMGSIIVYATGGTTFAYLHILYIPIILSGFIFSVWGGIIAGLIAGLLIGPFMPIHDGFELSQPFSSWALRMFMFALVGAIAGGGSSVFKAYIKELEVKHTTDQLTGLPNLNGLTQIFSTLIRTVDKAIIIVVIELSQIDEIDKALGEEKANILMKQVAKDLKQAVGEHGTIGRLQAHRFAILIPKEEHVTEILNRCESLSEKTYDIGNIPIFIEMRFGISRYPYDDKDLNNLTRKALIAVNVTKNQLQRVSHFDKNADDSSERNLLILHQLKIAIDKQSLVLEYQPKVNLQTGKVMGFEALVRWFDPLLGPINPADFIPLTEETLLINPLTKWALEKAIHQLHLWKKLKILVPISVNFSMKNFHDPSIMETLNQLLEKYKVPPSFLEVEVTETSVASSLTTISLALGALREVGVRVAIDDFGTGQASQQYLFELPINVIKLDKVFVQSISHNPAAASIVKNAITLAHELNLEVIAEGLETQNQFELLKNWGCDGGQGYLFGQSMKGEDATDWLKKNIKSPFRSSLAKTKK